MVELSIPRYTPDKYLTTLEFNATLVFMVSSLTYQLSQVTAQIKSQSLLSSWLAALVMTFNPLKDGGVETVDDVRRDRSDPSSPPLVARAIPRPVADGGNTPMMALCDK